MNINQSTAGSVFGLLSCTDFHRPLLGAVTGTFIGNAIFSEQSAEMLWTDCSPVSAPVDGRVVLSRFPNLNAKRSNTPPKFYFI